MDFNVIWADVIESVIYGALGLILALIAFFVIDMLTPGHLGKQIAKEKNVALGIVAGCGILGACIIIAAAIAG